ncbi:unnamed protein product [Rotaria sp. Silwood1]|nr:unnamed protein product [Rotaria sp. Silwood1]
MIKMIDSIFALVLISVASPALSVGIYEQCGGEGYTGPTNCNWPLGCFRRSRWFSSCQTSCPGTDWECSSMEGYSSGAGFAKAWEQCGGEGWTGPQICSQYSCQWRSQWYAQCRPDCPDEWLCQGDGSSSTQESTHSPVSATPYPTTISTTVSSSGSCKCCFVLLSPTCQTRSIQSCSECTADWCAKNMGFCAGSIPPCYARCTA